MLISFSVKNFRSFGEEVTLNMVASNKITDHPSHCVPIGHTGKKVLRTAVIYGANAAGKSNLIKAMDVAQRLIREPLERIQITPFRFDSELVSQPTTFEFRFMAAGRVFAYGFDVMRTRFTAEWLAIVNGDTSDDVVFERDEAGLVNVPERATRLFPGDDVRTFLTLNALRQLDVRADQLFLTRALSIPEPIQGRTLGAIVKWLTTDLLVLPVNSRSADLLDRLQDDSRFRLFCSRFLSNVGTGVGGLDIQKTKREGTEWERRYLAQLAKQQGAGKIYPHGASESDIIPEPDNPGSVIVRTLLSEHHISPNTFQLPFSEESDGTQALLHLMPTIACKPNQSRVVVLDELDRSLHPLICWELIRFFSETTEGVPKQLIVTTHEAHLLNHDLLRRDEYWFAEKDAMQQTRLVPLLDFKIRNDLQIERGYLSGRFGAIPFIGGMSDLEKLLECSESEVTDAAQTAPS